MTKPIIIDTREDFEFAGDHVATAINIPPAKFMNNTLPDQLNNTPKDQEIIVYCRSGSRSNVVLHILRQYGFTNLRNGINRQHVEKYLSAK